MALQIGFNPSADSYAGYVNPNAHSGMGDWAGPGGGAYPGMSLGGGYTPAVIAAGVSPVNTGNEIGSWPPATPTKWGSEYMGGATSAFAPYTGPINTGGWESFTAGTYPGGGAYGFPMHMNPYDIDNIVQPAPAYPTMNAPYNIAAPWVNPWGSMFGGTGFTTQYGRDN